MVPTRAARLGLDKRLGSPAWLIGLADRLGYSVELMGSWAGLLGLAWLPGCLLAGRI